MMQTHIKTSFTLYLLTLFVCFNSFFLGNSAAQVNNESDSSNYTFETIDVPGVEFLAVTASIDSEGYAGYTKSADGEKEVAFTFIDGVFTHHDFPGSKNTYFYALSDTGIAAGHYEDNDGLHHGVVLENGELRRYDFPNAAQTEIYDINDTTGVLAGNYIDAEGVRRGFSGDEIIEYPEASATYTFSVNALGVGTGGYIDAEGKRHGYVRFPDGNFVSADLPGIGQLEYLFVRRMNIGATSVMQAKEVGGVPRTYIGTLEGIYELRFPGSVSTEGWYINQDGSVVGYYDTADGRRHGFIARLSRDTVPPDGPDPVSFTYTFESIDVPGVDFLELAASSDFEGYAGNTRSADGEKTIAFTLIDGVFTTYDFPGSKNTYFYALGNDGTAAGHYEDSDGLHRGVILQDGELRQYDFPGSVQTEIYGFSDATGVLTGNFVDAEGVRRGFTGDTVVEVPGAPVTYADFVNSHGSMVGSYIDDDGIYHPYGRTPEGRIVSIQMPGAENLEYFFLHGINDIGISVARSKLIGDVPRTYVGTFVNPQRELQFPGAVSTEGWNINQDGSIVGHYDSADGRRHGFIARPVDEAESNRFDNVYNVTLEKGLNMVSVPLAPPTPMYAKSLAGLTGGTTIITIDAPNQRFIAWTPGAPDDGFPIEGGGGYIVNVQETRNFAFVGAPWTNAAEAAAAPPAASLETLKEVWAFVVTGHLEGVQSFDGYRVSVRNLRTKSTITAPVQGDYFAAAAADLSRWSVVQVGDVVEVHVIGPNGVVESQTVSYKVTTEHLADAVMSVRLDSIGRPKLTQLLQNYPNPFNPETWIPYQLSEDSPVSISIYDTTGNLVRTMSIGFQSAGFYNSRDRAAYWDGRNAVGERVASGTYFYRLKTPSFHQTRRLVIVK